MLCLILGNRYAVWDNRLILHEFFKKDSDFADLAQEMLLICQSLKVLCKAVSEESSSGRELEPRTSQNCLEEGKCLAFQSLRRKTAADCTVPPGSILPPEPEMSGRFPPGAASPARSLISQGRSGVSRRSG